MSILFLALMAFNKLFREHDFEFNVSKKLIKSWANPFLVKSSLVCSLFFSFLIFCFLFLLLIFIILFLVLSFLFFILACHTESFVECRCYILFSIQAYLLTQQNFILIKNFIFLIIIVATGMNFRIDIDLILFLLYLLLAKYFL